METFISFRDFLLKNVAIDPTDLDPILGQYQDELKEHTFKKGELIIQPGTICKNTFFVESGLLRFHSIDKKGKEHILGFAPEGWFIADRDSHYYNLPTNNYIEALEDSTVIMFEKDIFPLLGQQAPAIAVFHDRLLQNHIRHLQKRINSLLSATAEERYLEFTKIYPDIMLRVPQWMVASYLGIAPESLSRVRKDLANKWKEQNGQEH